VVTVSSESSNGVTAADDAGLGHGAAMVLVVVAVVGAEGGGARRQRLRRGGSDRRAGQVAVRRLALVAVQRSVVRRGLRRRVNGAPVVEGVVWVGADAGNDAKMSAHAGSLNRRQGHVRVLVIHL